MTRVLPALYALSLCLALVSCSGGAKQSGCKADKDCKNGQSCVANKCVECTEDKQCGKGMRCSANACIAAPECTKDSDCSPLGRVCQAGKCKACASDSECASGKCNAGLCAAMKPCTKDDQCADDEDCLNGFCHKAGTGAGADATCTLSTVYFAFDDSSIQQSERDRLTANAQCIDKNKSKSVYVVGHTDTSGTEEYNIALSERRAQSVADFLARLGTDPARMQVVPKGETEPTGLGDDKDRRVEFQWH